MLDHKPHSYVENKVIRADIKLLSINEQHPLRGEVEQYVATRYAHAFNASITEFMPTFMAIYQSGQLLSVCGYRVASQSQLFLEQYLQQPADIIMSTEFGESINRNKLIEFGQLASFSRGMSPLHFMLMTQHLVDLGFEWCIFTATDPLYVMMCRLGLHPHMLANADHEHIANAQSNWGTYYHKQPCVSAGNLRLGLSQLTKRFDRLSGPDANLKVSNQ
jgi:hypothetical protein